MTKPDFKPSADTMKLEISRLNAQLAKANDRVKELKKELKESEDDLDAAEQQLSSYENALEEVQAVFVDSDVCPLFEPFNPRNLSAWLNKFAIEKKIEGVNDFCATLQGYEDVQPIGANYVTSITSHRDSFTEQLRKE